MEREAPFFLKGSFHTEALWNDFGSQSFLKAPDAPLASLAALALRRFIGVSLGFWWGFAGDLGSQTSPTIFLCFFACSGSFWIAKKLPRSMPKTFRKSSKISPQHPQNRSQNLPKSNPKRSKIEVWRGFRWKSFFDPKLSPLFSAPGGVLGRPGGVLGASWGRLGAALGV